MLSALCKASAKVTDHLDLALLQFDCLRKKNGQGSKPWSERNIPKRHWPKWNLEGKGVFTMLFPQIAGKL
jgi:hypothetical protein